MARMAHKWSIIRSMHHPMTNHNAAAVEAMCGRTPLRGDLELLDDDALSFPSYGAVLSYLMPDSPIGLPHVASAARDVSTSCSCRGKRPDFSARPTSASRSPTTRTPPQFDVSTLQTAGRRFGRPAQESQSTPLGHRSPGGQPADDAAAADRSRSITARRSPFCVPRPSAQPGYRQGAGPAPRPLWPQHAGAEHALGPPAGRVGRAVRQRERPHSQRTGGELGQPPERLPAASRSPSAAGRPGIFRPARGSRCARACWTARSSSPWANSDAARGSTRTPAATIGPTVYSVMLAGGGIQGGRVLGTSDKIGAYPATDPVSPGDLAATIFSSFGARPAARNPRHHGPPLATGRRPSAGGSLLNCTVKLRR